MRHMPKGRHKMPVVSELINILGFKFEGEQNLRKFKSEMDKAEKEAKAQEKRMTAVGNKIGLAIGGAAIIAGATVKKAYMDYTKFERSMTRIGITAGANRKQIQDITDDMYQMANRFALPIEAVRSGLDTLTASGMSLDEAMKFLPSVLATAQASGAAVEDIANTAIKTSSALKINTADLQNMFDILNTGGKLGQFELKDMASYMPGIANSWANLGYTGLEGTQRLVAMLQTLRAHTGTAEAAATQAGEIIGKALAPGQINNFEKNFDFDIEKKMKAALANGEDFLEAYVRLSKEALGGDMSKIGQLFTDKQMREGMTSMMNFMDENRKYLQDLKGADVAGSTMRDLNEVLRDQESILQRLGNQWDQFMTTLGAMVAPSIGAGLTSITKGLTHDAAAVKYLTEKEGYSTMGALAALATSRPETADLYARKGGYAFTEGQKETQKNAPHAYEVLGRYPQRPNSTVGRGFGAESPSGASYIPPRDPTMVPRSDASGAFGVKTKTFAETSPDIMNMLAGMDARLAEITGQAPVDANITDAKQDNRNQSITVGGTTVNVTQAVDAPKAVGDAVTARISESTRQAQAARIQAEPSQ